MQKITENELPDAVIPRFGAKIDYFSLLVLKQLQKMEIPLINEVESLEIARDKLVTLQTLAEAKIPIPKSLFAKIPLNLETINQVFDGNYPLILKKASGSQGKGVLLIQNEDNLKDIVEMVDTSHPLIIQEFIAKSIGRDIRVIVIGGKAIGGMMRVAKKGFKSNFHQGGYVKPVKLNKDIEWLACEVARLAKLQVAGIDILLDKHTYRICEVNSSPGFQGFELGTGVDVAKSILNHLISVCGVHQIEKKIKKKNSCFSTCYG